MMNDELKALVKSNLIQFGIGFGGVMVLLYMGIPGYMAMAIMVAGCVVYDWHTTQQAKKKSAAELIEQQTNIENYIQKEVERRLRELG